MNSSDTLHLQLVRAASARNSLMRIIGEVGAEIKKDQKRFLKQHNMDSLKAYLAQPDVNIAESTFNTSVRLWNVYGPNGLDITEEQWVSIGPRKLGIIAPTVSEELLGKAEYLSVSDLLIEIKGDTESHSGQNRGKPVANGEVLDGVENTSPLSPAKYKKLVKESPCCVCHREAPQVQIHSHHFPRTRKMLDKDEQYKAIPLCGICHQEYHQDPLKFWNNYKANIMDFFYRLIVQ